MEKSKYGQKGNVRGKNGPRDYICNRASGLSSRLQTQQSTGPDIASQTNICCYCCDTYSQQDRMVLTRCCKIAIGSGCNAQHIAEFGSCWNCDEEQVTSEAAFVAESQVSHDRNCHTKDQPPPFSQSVFHHSIHHVGSQPTTATVNAHNTNSGGSATEGSNSTGVFNMRGFAGSQFLHPIFIRLHEDESTWKLAQYQRQNAEESTKNAKATSLSPRNLIAEHMQNGGLARKGLDMAKANNIEEQEFLYNGSESDYFGFSPDGSQDQQHLHDLAQKENRSGEAKEYVIGAIRHLVEVCNAYGDDIDEADKVEVIDEIIGVWPSVCPTFQAAKRILRKSSALPTRPVAVQTSAPFRHVRHGVRGDPDILQQVQRE